MEIFKNIHVPAALFGVLLCIFGINVMLRGNIWNLILVSPEKYYVGGLAILSGTYIFLLGIKTFKA